MIRISDYFLRLAVLAGLIAMALGIHMGMNQDFRFIAAHAHLNLLGWVSMAIYGLFYRIVPAAAAGMLPRIHFVLAVAGLLVMIPGLFLVGFAMPAGGPVTGIGSIITIAGFLVFAIIVTRATARAA